MRKPILFIQGAGNKHKPLGSGKLIAYLQEQLGSDYHVLAPDLPDPDHPRYLGCVAKTHGGHDGREASLLAQLMLPLQTGER
jgi:hypothetical protein